MVNAQQYVESRYPDKSVSEINVVNSMNANDRNNVNLEGDLDLSAYPNLTLVAIGRHMPNLRSLKLAPSSRITRMSIWQTGITDYSFLANAPSMQDICLPNTPNGNANRDIVGKVIRDINRGHQDKNQATQWLQTQFAQSQRENENLKQQLQEHQKCQTEKNQLQNQVNNLNNTNSQLQNQNQSLQTQLTTTQFQNTQLQNEKNTLQQEKQSLNNQLEQSKKEKAAAEQARDDLKKEKEQLTQQIQEKEQEIAKLNQQLQEHQKCQAEKEKLQAQITQLQQQIAGLQAEIGTGAPEMFAFIQQP